jgi:hypothetical protein
VQNIETQLFFYSFSKKQLYCERFSDNFLFYKSPKKLMWSGEAPLPLHNKSKRNHRNMYFLHTSFPYRYLLPGLVSLLLLSSCTFPSSPPVQPYRRPSPDLFSDLPQQAYPSPQQHSVPGGFSPAEQAAYTSQVLEPTLATVRGRITTYSEKIRAWQELGNRRESLSLSPDQLDTLISCRNQVTGLHDDYGRLEDSLRNAPTIEASRQMILGSLQGFKERDIAYLESECPKMFTDLRNTYTQQQQIQVQDIIPHYIEDPYPSQAQDYSFLVQSFEDNLRETRRREERRQPQQVHPYREVEELPPYQHQVIQQQSPRGQDRYYEEIVIQQPQEQVIQQPPSRRDRDRSYEELGVQQQVMPRVNIEERYREALSLLQGGRKLEARKIFIDLIPLAQGQGERAMEIKTLETLAELEIGLREYASARRRYESLQGLERKKSHQDHLQALESAGSRQEEVDTYAALVLGCLSYRPEQDGFTVIQQAEEFVRRFPRSSLSPHAKRLAKDYEQQAEQWFSGLLTSAQHLKAEQKHEEALRLLRQVPLDILPFDKQETLRQEKDDLLLTATGLAAVQRSQAQEQSIQAPAPASGHQGTWDQGMMAFETERYDEAIETFSSLLNTSFRARAEQKIEEAARLAGQNLRKKAAQLFQRAGNATDPAAKRELLLSSKALLEDILHKYPQAGIETQVRRNVNSVDKELSALGNEDWKQQSKY